jgi:glyceraldehyde-3-phosphate dehydrogenase/erythrose-4-phosphate dehydrogenase
MENLLVWFRVPTTDVSVVDLTVKAKETSYEEVMAVLKLAQKLP